jgi:putative endonuclease
MITVYVIKSLNKNFRYVGITNDLEKRLKQHNNGKNRSTKSYMPFKLVLTETHEDYRQARTREKFLKSGAGRKYLDSLI